MKNKLITAALILTLIAPAVALSAPEIPVSEAARQYNAANGLYRDGRFEDAVLAYEEALDLNPGSAETRVNRGAALLAMEDIEGALKDFESAIESRPGFHAAWTGKSIALRRLGRYDEAREAQLEADRLRRK